MKAAGWTIAVALVSVSILAALGQLRLDDRNQGPGESARETFDQRFALANAITCTKRIDRSLSSFAALTKLAKGKLTAAAIQKVGNTDAETQALGFPNWVGVIECTLRKQGYQIAKLEYELAVTQHKAKRISTSALNQKRTAYRKAEKDFQRFWDQFSIAD